ncbi:MAG: serine/threonine-protein kinase [Acidobacteria bacterium]|nr:serine/threonine-protein kinase [Acidobacteriota bacterium]
MTISPGSRLGPYEILAPIGAGGMGEVYRAKDPRLGRDVAIKVLPASFSADADRLRRFEQEARAAGILNHPNITAVLDIGEHDGAPYVVQELLEGETLRQALAGGKLSQRRAIDFAVQIAHGLAAAHEKGIVHRDLKPENVFVTKDGRVKILDFGLAKLTHMGEGSSATDLPTATAGTEPGMVLGTLGYMSPEQVRGRPADARSDIFSFGAILYEMLAGQRAFRGDSAADTMSAILREDPPDLSVTNQNVSPGLERVIRHCLEKSPEQRFHSAHDLAFDLEALSGVSLTRGAPSTPRIRGRFPSKAILAASLATLAAGLLAGRLIWRASPLSAPSFHRLTYGRGPIGSARFAPDGRTIVYSALWDGARKPQLYSVRVESPESLNLTHPGDVESVSRTGDMLVLNAVDFSVGYARKGTLSQTPLSGSAPRDLLEDVSGADWSPDGRALAVVRAPQWRYRLEFPLGKVLYQTTGWIGRPRVSPGGDVVAFFDHPVFGDDRGSLAIVDLAGKKRTLSSGWESEQGIAWSVSGEEIWFTATQAGSSRALYAVTTSGRQRLVARTPGGMLLQDISGDGRVLFIQSNARLGFLGLLPGDARERDLSGLEWSYGPLLSEDGKTAVFTEQGEAGGPGYSVYMRKLDGSAPVRLGEGNALALSPDGKWVLTCLLRSTPPSIVLLPTGAGEPRAFPKDAIDHSNGLFGAFLPDGKRVIFRGNEPGRPPRIFLQDLQGGAARAVSPEGVTAMAISPDGASLVVHTAEQGFGIAPLEGGPARPIPGIDPTDRPLRWTADGRFLFVGSTRREFPSRVFRIEVATGHRELWKELMPGDPAGLTLLAPAAISVDGKSILFNFGRFLSELYIAEGLK